MLPLSLAEPAPEFLAGVIRHAARTETVVEDLSGRPHPKELARGDPELALGGVPVDVDLGVEHLRAEVVAVHGYRPFSRRGSPLLAPASWSRAALLFDDVCDVCDD